MNATLYGFQLFFYAVGMLFYATYSLLQFISKPGTRFLFPIVVIAAVALFEKGLLYFSFISYAQNHLVSDPTYATIIGSVMSLIALFVVGWAYVYLSRFLGTLLGIFPTISRPLMPQMKLAAPKETNSQPVPVRVVVPPLSRR